MDFYNLKEWFIKNKISLILSSSFFVIMLLINISLFFYFDNKVNNINDKELIAKEESIVVNNINKEEVFYKVEVKGSVKTPGVYELKEGSRVIDAINEAGGLLENADTSVNNLGKLIKDEMVIIVYTKDEVKEFAKVLEKEIATEEKCLTNNGLIENDSCIENNEKEINSSNKKNDNNSNSVNGKISINKATKEELMNLSGIGEAKADKIIEYRNKNGLFKSIEEIMNVSGIGEAIFVKIKDYITVE